jgi:hypothetical protein
MILTNQEKKVKKKSGLNKFFIPQSEGLRLKMRHSFIFKKVNKLRGRRCEFQSSTLNIFTFSKKNYYF